MTLKSRVLHGGPLPAFINLFDQPPARVCAVSNSKRKLNGVTINGWTMQAVVWRHYLAFQAECKENGIQVHPISALRNCKQQKEACDGICGHGCAGCPGLCAPCGVSSHQTGAAVDNAFRYDHNYKRPNGQKRYPNWDAAWKTYEQIANKHNFFSFSGMHGGDPLHLSFEEAR